MKSGIYIYSYLIQENSFFPLLSGFGLWNQCVATKGRKARIRAFSFALGAFAFFALLRALFCIALASAKARKKRGRPPLSECQGRTIYFREFGGKSGVLEWNHTGVRLVLPHPPPLPQHGLISPDQSALDKRKFHQQISFLLTLISPK
jgi:hypothetical protein